jgi:glycosyltransferase involved in cell wall biosynthesis
MNNPSVSIIIPTYNRAHLIGETLDSIIAQTYANWECIIVDDGSADNSTDLIDSYIKKDNRFHYHQRPVDRIKGANACRNYGFELSEGKYIKWFDSDDIMHPNFLEKQVLVLESNCELDFCACFSKKFSKSVFDANEDFNPEIIYDDDNAIYNFIVGKLYCLTPSSLWERKFLKNKFLFDETLYNAHETDFNFRRLIEGGRFCYTEDVLFYVRRGHQSIDQEANKNPLSLQSQFDYFQKAFNFINSDENILVGLKTKELEKYLIYRQVHFFYDMRVMLDFKKNINNFKIILNDLIKADLYFFDFLRLLLGIVIVLFFKKGYSLIHIKKFDVRDYNKTIS